jgi:hypothetical protein
MYYTCIYIHNLNLTADFGNAKHLEQREVTQ